MFSAKQLQFLKTAFRAIRPKNRADLLMKGAMVGGAADVAGLAFRTKKQDQPKPAKRPVKRRRDM